MTFYEVARARTRNFVARQVPWCLIGQSERSTPEKVGTCQVLDEDKTLFPSNRIPSQP